MVESDRDIALMIDECERALGKILRVGEIAKLIALRDYLGFAPDYIIALCEHCAKIGKNTVRYLETTAVALYDDGITDKETLDEHLRRTQEKHDIEIQIARIACMTSGFNLMDDQKYKSCKTRFKIMDKVYRAELKRLKKLSKNPELSETMEGYRQARAKYIKLQNRYLETKLIWKIFFSVAKLLKKFVLPI